MKKTAVKRISAVVFTIIMLFAVSLNAYAETWQDRIEQSVKDFSGDYNSADPDTQASIQESFDKFLAENGLESIDLGSLSETDIGQIFSGIGDNLSIDSFFGLAGDAFSSGMNMIQDAIGSGSGTSDGSATATTKPATITSPNIIIANPAPESSTVAVGVPEQNMPVTNAPTTYKVESTTAPNILGAGVTTTAPPVAVEDSASSSSMAVLIALSVSTVAVIVAIVIFFVLKKK